MYIYMHSNEDTQYSVWQSEQMAKTFHVHLAILQHFDIYIYTDQCIY